jgi:hypothetical protein
MQAMEEQTFSASSNCVQILATLVHASPCRKHEAIAADEWHDNDITYQNITDINHKAQVSSSSNGPHSGLKKHEGSGMPWNVK